MSLVDHIRAVQKKLHLLVDGKPGPATWNAVHRAVVSNRKPDEIKRIDDGTAGGEGKIADARSERNIHTLLPAVRPFARALIEKAAGQGIIIKVTSGTRTFEEQDKLFAQGRTKPGKIVTKARGGHSNHNFGIAFDVTIFKGSTDPELAKTPVYESPLYKAIGALGTDLGLEWGGKWTSIVDEPHFQLRPSWAIRISERDMLAELRAREISGQDVFAGAAGIAASLGKVEPTGSGTLVAESIIKKIQALLKVEIDGIWGPKSQGALNAEISKTRGGGNRTLGKIQKLLGVERNGLWSPVSQEALNRRIGASGGFKAVASSFADPADVIAFKKCKAQGRTDQQCFKAGDNGVGQFGKITAQTHTPMVALHESDMRAKWGSVQASAHRPVTVTVNGKTIQATVEDRLGVAGRIDLNPAAAKELGLDPPFLEDECVWKWV